MSNTTTKVNSFGILGYVLTVEAANKQPIEPSSEISSIENDNISSQNIKEQENILPSNNQVLKTINLNTNYGGLRI